MSLSVCGGRLHGIAPVDEQGGLVPEHDGQTRRTRKARRPQQPLLIGREIFVLVAVGAGDDEAGEALPVKGGAQSGDAGLDGGRAAEVGEGLVSGLLHGPLGDRAALVSPAAGAWPGAGADGRAGRGPAQGLAPPAPFQALGRLFLHLG